jgi:hypothetical protein
MMVDVDDLERAARVGMQRAGGDRIVTMRADEAMDVAVELRAARGLVEPLREIVVAYKGLPSTAWPQGLGAAAAALAAYDKVTGEAPTDA